MSINAKPYNLGTVDGTANHEIFKDAPVDTAGEWVESVTVSTQGDFTETPTLVFSGGGGSGAAGTAVLEGVGLVSITMTARGSGYTTAPTVTPDPEVTTTAPSLVAVLRTQQTSPVAKDATKALRVPKSATKVKFYLLASVTATVKFYAVDTQLGGDIGLVGPCIKQFDVAGMGDDGGAYCDSIEVVSTDGDIYFSFACNETEA